LNTIFLVSEIRRNEQHDGFINAVTHELKTPIASIRLYLETLQTREVDEVHRKEFYSVMLMDTARLLRTVEQVLQAGRTGQRRRQLDRSVIDLGAVVQECLQTGQTQLNRATIKYSERLDNGARPLVLGDHDELRVAVSNLVDNAVKYSPTSPRVAVEVADFDEKRVAVRVSDSGIGIPRGQLKRIFKRFYRIPARLVSQVNGSGLGLFIVQSVVERHGGRVFAESAGEGMGSTFTIVLPKA
jgi:signal transduction histidine kinase